MTPLVAAENRVIRRPRTSEFAKIFRTRKTRMIRLPCAEKM